MSNSTIFSGNSRYANDFQSVIDRSVAIASLPLTQLNNVKAGLNDQSSALGSIDTKFGSLQAAIQSLASAIGLSSYSTSVSNSAIVSASLSEGAMGATYSIEVTGLGAYETLMSADGLVTVTDPATQSFTSGASFTLSLDDGTPHTATVTGNNLNDLVRSINSSGLDLQASIVNVASGSSPDYRLSIQGAKLGKTTIQLLEGTEDRLAVLSDGAPANYKLNGMATEVSSSSRTVSLAPGLTVTLLGKSNPGVPTTVSVSRNAAGVSNALSSFVNSYNAAMDELDRHRGENEGALTGQGIVYTLAQSLRIIVSYSSGSGDISSLTDLGLSFDQNGRLSFDAAVFADATSGKIDALMSFLGDSTGGGFLKSATDLLSSVEDSSNGVIHMSLDSLQSQINQQDRIIDETQERIDRFRESLQAQMTAADALIASLEQQVNYFNGMFESMRIASQGYK